MLRLRCGVVACLVRTNTGAAIIILVRAHAPLTDSRKPRGRRWVVQPIGGPFYNRPEILLWFCFGKRMNNSWTASRARCPRLSVIMDERRLHPRKWGEGRDVLVQMVISLWSTAPDWSQAFRVLLGGGVAANLSERKTALRIIECPAQYHAVSATTLFFLCSRLVLAEADTA